MDMRIDKRRNGSTYARVIVKQSVKRSLGGGESFVHCYQWWELFYEKIFKKVSLKERFEQESLNSSNKYFTKISTKLTSKIVQVESLKLLTTFFSG